MNRRLQAIEALVEDGVGLIDVGTDHGYLPLALAKRGYPGALIAADIGVGPLNAAKRNAAEAGLEQRIRFLLCDGLERCQPQAVDTIVIAGMGGDTICGILDRAEWVLDPRYTLLLQPMTRAEVLRYWLTNNGFSILEERLVRDNGAIYALLRARYGGEVKLTDAELYTGAFPLIERDALWPELLSLQLRRLEKSIAGLEQGERDPGRLRLLRGIFRELKEREVYAKRKTDL